MAGLLMKLYNASSQKAYEFLHHKLFTAFWKQGDRLPPIRQLALSLHVSCKAMNEAVARLGSQGLLHSIAHRGTVAGKLLVKERVFRQSHKWQRIRQKVEIDILSGRYTGSGFTRAELSNTYGVSRATLTKVLRALTEEKVVVQRGKSYHPAFAAHRGSSATIWVALRSFAKDSIGLFNPRVNEFVTHSYRVAHEHGIVLKSSGLNETAVNSLPDFFKKATDSIGLILYARMVPADFIREYAVRAARLKIPVAIIDEGGEPVSALFDLPASQRSLLRVFSAACDSEVPGREMGRLLFRNGHRRIAYFSVADREANPWSIRRFRGLESVFCDQPHGGTVLDVWDLLKTTLVQPMVSGADTLAESVDTVRNDFPDLCAMLEKINRRLTMGEVWPLHHSLERTGSELTSFLSAQQSYATMLPIMENVLKDKTITAWVADSDSMATVLHYFLHQKKVTIPGTIALAGFDNATFAIEQSITPYDFSFAEIARHAISHIVNPRQAIYRPDSPFVVPGFVVERSSTK